MANEEKKVDITGLMHAPIPGWEKRVKELAKAEHFRVGIYVAPELSEKLSASENERLTWKLDLVADAVRYMAAGMLKGTVKYDTDAYTVEQWMAHVVGEGADQMNYQILLANGYAKELARRNEEFKPGDPRREK